ncbi:MAG: RNA polymerase sigma factor [Deltaproteobacteria bacterium]|nr:RNA polymerase sigma factor [Deltaproteobacteria bacterium]
MATPDDAAPSQAIDEDREDVRAAFNGDGEAFGRIVHRYQSEIAKSMWRFTRDPTAHRELVQDVFVNAYLSLHTYKELAPFSHWLRKIAVRTGHAYWRNRSRETSRVDESALRNIAQPPVGNDPKEAGELVHHALGCLPPRDRLVLTLLYLEGHSLEEIAELTGWSLSMVKVQAWRARKKLKKILSRMEKEA